MRPFAIPFVRSFRVVIAAALAAILLATLAGCTASPAQTRPPDAVYVSANRLVFDQPRVEAPAGVAFQLYFENLEAVPHNVNVADSSGASVARGEVFSGPSGRTLEVPVLAAGTYKLLCDVHPDMNAELVASDN